MFLVVPITFLTALTLASVIQNKQGFPQSPTKHIQHQQIFIYTCCVNSNNTSIIIFRWGPKLNGSLPEPFQLYSRASVKKGVRNWHLNNVWSEQFNISRYKDRVEVTFEHERNMVCMSWKIQMLQPGDDNAFRAAYRNDESSGGQFKLCNGKVQVLNSKYFQPTVGPTHNVPTESTRLKETKSSGLTVVRGERSTSTPPMPPNDTFNPNITNDKLLLLLLLLLVPIIAVLYYLLQKKTIDNIAISTMKPGAHQGSGSTAGIQTVSDEEKESFLEGEDDTRSNDAIGAMEPGAHQGSGSTAGIQTVLDKEKESFLGSENNTVDEKHTTNAIVDGTPDEV